MAPLKIFEVDEHHHVLLSEEITSAFQEKAGKGGILLNFDSHDDWGMSLVRHTLWNDHKRRTKDRALITLAELFDPQLVQTTFMHRRSSPR
jgi:hypothetical protein